MSRLIDPRDVRCDTVATNIEVCLRQISLAEESNHILTDILRYFLALVHTVGDSIATLIEVEGRSSIVQRARVPNGGSCHRLLLHFQLFLLFGHLQRRLVVSQHRCVVLEVPIVVVVVVAHR